MSIELSQGDQEIVEVIRKLLDDNDLALMDAAFASDISGSVREALFAAMSDFGRRALFCLMLKMDIFERQRKLVLPMHFAGDVPIDRINVLRAPPPLRVSPN